MKVGKSTASTQGIAAFFRPYISRGDLLCITECRPEQLPVIEREAPNLLDAFLQIEVEEPTSERGATMLLNYAVVESQRGSAPIAPDGIETLHHWERGRPPFRAYNHSGKS